MELWLGGWLGENTVTVTADNSLEPNCRWYSGSGIYSPVTLIVREREHIRSLRIQTVSIDPAVIRVDTDADSVEIYDAGALVASGRPGLFTIPNARLWSEEHPHLYTCAAKTATDEKRVQFGVRTLTWDAKTGLCVNGRCVLLRGGCIHHDHGILGACEYREAEERRIRILKENGFNAVRIAHNPASEILLETCDRLGMYVMNECFDGWYTPKTYHDYSRIFWDDWKTDLAAMVEASCNHPSVILYSIGNEVTETTTKKGVAICRDMTDFVHGLDDTRPVTAGINVLLNVYTNMGLGIYRDKGAYRPERLPEGKSYRERKTGSAFFNAMAGRLRGLMFTMSRGRKGDRASRGAGEALDILGLNYASGRYDENVKTYPDRLMVGSETMAGDLPYNWDRVKKYPQLIGDFVWAAWDYLGEACMGYWTYHSYKCLPLFAGQGMIDATGLPLASMAYMQIVWGMRKTPYIAVRPLNHAGERPSTGAWQFTNAIDSWTWQGYEGTNAVVEVYSDAPRVRLTLNGKPVGIKRTKNGKAKFRVLYAAGTLSAESLDESGAVIAKSDLVTGGAETVLTARPEKQTVKSSELVYVSIEFTDENGVLKPYDPQRTDFLYRYLGQLKRAVGEGIPVLGYQHWSVMDNFEWAEGYDPRFGLVYVDYATGNRIIKDSALAYRQIIETNGGTLCVTKEPANPDRLKWVVGQGGVSAGSQKAGCCESYHGPEAGTTADDPASFGCLLHGIGAQISGGRTPVIGCEGSVEA